MKSFPTSRYKKYKVKYYYDVEWRNKEASMLLLNYQQMMLSKYSNSRKTLKKWFQI